MIKPRKTLLVTVPALLVSLSSGCIRPDYSWLGEPVKPNRSLDQRICCDPVGDLDARPLAVNRYTTLVVDRNDLVVELPSGMSFARAVELPEIPGEYVLQIDSVVNTPRMDLFPEAMYPMVTLLDEDREIVSVHSDLPLDYRRPILGPNLLRIVVTVPEASPARYAVLHTSRERTRYGMSAHPPYEVVTRNGFDTLIYSRPSQSRHKIHFVETGMLTLLAYDRASPFPPVPGPSERNP
jgi:hypothetical protein